MTDASLPPLEDRVYKQGYLEKQGTHWKTWHRRWCVLRIRSFAYYKDSESFLKGERSLGSLRVDATIAAADPEDWTKAETHFQILTPERALQVRADSAVDKAAWVEACNQLRTDLSVSPDGLLQKYNIAVRTELLIAEMLTGCPWEEAPGVMGASHAKTPSSLDGSALSTGSFSPPGSRDGSTSLECRRLALSTDSTDAWTQGSQAQHTPPDHTAAGSLASTLPPASPGPVQTDSDRKDSSPRQPPALTIEQLIQRVTDADRPLDMDFRKAFLLHHVTFTTPEDIFQRFAQLIRRPLAEYTDARACLHHKLHVMTVIEEWLMLAFDDYPRISDGLAALLNEIKQAKGLEFLPDTVHKAVELARQSEVRRLAAYSPPTPEVLQAVASSRMEPLDFDAQLVAEQMTIIDAAQFAAVRAREFVNKAWKVDNGSRTPNLTRMIDTFNKRSLWAATEILNREHHDQRVAAVGFLVRLSSKLRKMGNYYSSAALIVGLSQQPIFRLKRVWTDLPRKIKDKFTALQQLSSAHRNYAAYRSALAKGLGKPQMPNLCVHLKDLYQLEEFTWMTAPGRIQFAKYEKQWEQLSLILQCQQHRFELPLHDQCYASLHLSLDHNLSEDKMWARSLRFEPRLVAASP